MSIYNAATDLVHTFKQLGCVCSPCNPSLNVLCSWGYVLVHYWKQKNQPIYTNGLKLGYETFCTKLGSNIDNPQLQNEKL